MMNQILYRFTMILLTLYPVCCLAIETRIELPSSFNPVGSGIRALGMGGAFIGIANDATAASWNPGGLNILEKSELSLVLSGVRRNEKINFGTNPEGSGDNAVHYDDINYLSIACPLKFCNRHITLSMSYQHLYNFNRRWQFRLNTTDMYHDLYEYWQTGRLTALGLSFCVEIIPELSAGITLNVWDDSLSKNSADFYHTKWQDYVYY